MVTATEARARYRKRIKAWLGVTGHSQSDLARAIGIHPVTLSSKMLGKNDFTETEMRDITAFFKWRDLEGEGEEI